MPSVLSKEGKRDADDNIKKVLVCVELAGRKDCFYIKHKKLRKGNKMFT